MCPADLVYLPDVQLWQGQYATYKLVNEKLTGAVPKQMDNSEQTAFHCDPLSWCI